MCSKCLIRGTTLALVISLQSCLFECLKKTKLIEDVSKANYSRCGRTDKGVSALGQVVAMELRTNLLQGPGVKVQDGSIAHTRKGDTDKELPYMVILNRNLPDDIRVLSWTPVDPDFSARFSCTHRTYKYFFPRGDMNLEVIGVMKYCYSRSGNFYSRNISEVKFSLRLISTLAKDNCT